MAEGELLANIKSWRASKLVLHHKLSASWRGLTSYAPSEHHVFPCSTSDLLFLPVTTLDGRSRPWTSILAGADGRPGFTTHSPCKTELEITARLWEGDPMHAISKNFFGRCSEAPVSGVGIELRTRKSYRKFAGTVAELTAAGEHCVRLRLRVNQALRHCPKYMSIRDLVPHAHARPRVIYSELDLREPLPDDVTAFIRAADTVFLGATFFPDTDISQAPLHIETNIRGGRPGFIRVSPSDGRTLILPDFSGNRLITSLGRNEEASGALLASLTVISFTTGDVLYITGNARRLIAGEARAVMPHQNTLTVLEATGAVLVRDAVPVRERSGSAPVRSIYSPPVKLLAEESKLPLSNGVQLHLVRVRVHSIDLATFDWELPPEHKGVCIQPGQAVVLDLAPFSDTPEYAHLAPALPRALHDDRVRTWTVSSAHASRTRTFSLTIRHKQGGLMSGALFLIAQQQQKKQQPPQTSSLLLRAGLIGFAGTFVLPPPPSRRLLWAAGGVGVTRFLAMLGALAQSREAADVMLVLSTRDPEVLFPLVRAALGADPPPGLRVRLDVFTTQPAQAQELMRSTGEAEMNMPGLRVQVYPGRITAAHWTTVAQIEEREVFVCGPGTFEDAMIESLRCAGAKVGVVHREVFEL